jgi:hypothetical protein
MATGDPVIYMDFSGGLNLEAGPYLLNDNECQDSRDVVASKSGALKKRLGSTRIGGYENTSDERQLASAHTLSATTGEFTGFIAVGRRDYLGYLQSLDPSILLPLDSEYLAADQSGNDRDGTGEGDIDIGAWEAGPYGDGQDSIVKITPTGTTTTLKTGLTTDSPWEWVQGPLATDETPDQGPYYGMNGVDTPQYWDGSAASTVDWTAGTGIMPANTPYLIYHLDKFWATGDPNYKGRIWSTGLNSDSTPLPDPCNWDTDYIDDVDPDDGQSTSGLGKVGPYLLVFKERKTYVLSDPAGRAYRTLSSNIGCSSHRSIVETDAGTLFFSEDLGICVTDGSNIRVVSEKIKPMLDDVAHSQPLALKRAVGSYHHGSYFLSIPYLATTNSITLEYQLDTQAWWIHTLPVADFALLDSGTTTDLYGVLARRAACDNLFDDDVYSDAGEVYDSYWQGPYWTWGNPHQNKRMSQLRIDGVGNWEVDAGTTFGDTKEQLDYTTWEEQVAVGTSFGVEYNFGEDGYFGGVTGAITERRYYTPTDGWGRAWSLKLYDVSNTINMELYSIAGYLRGRSD